MATTNVLVLSDNLMDCKDFRELMLDSSKSEKELIEIAIDAMRGCYEGLHKDGKTHRDVKLENIMCKEGSDRTHGILVDRDFVTAEVSDGGDAYSCGTVGYLDYLYYYNSEDHEFEIDSNAIDPSLDVFAFGIVLSEIYLKVNDGIINAKEERFLVSNKLVNKLIKGLNECSSMPEDVRELIMEMIQKDREKRPKLPEVIERLSSIVKKRFIYCTVKNH